MSRFTLPSVSTRDKMLRLNNVDIQLLVDYDDVEHATVRELTKLIIKHLNAIPSTEWDAAIKRSQADRSRAD